MRLLPTCVLVCGAMLVTMTAQAATPQLVPWALRTTVDTDGDGTPDLFDNAPGAVNNQADLDADLIGDVIDPTPVNSNPYLGDPGLLLGAPYTISSGSNVTIDYLMVVTPPGAWGYIDLDLGGNGIYDATYFGPLSTSLSQILIPVNQFEIPGLYSQNVPGSYPIYAKAFGPGMTSQFNSITGVNVVPEPTTLAMFASGLLLLLGYRRMRGASRE